MHSIIMIRIMTIIVRKRRTNRRVTLIRIIITTMLLIIIIITITIIIMITIIIIIRAIKNVLIHVPIIDQTQKTGESGLSRGRHRVEEDEEEEATVAHSS